MTMQPPPDASNRAGAWVGQAPSRRDNIAGPARAVIVLLVGCCATSLAVGLYSWRRAGLVHDVGEGATPSDATIETADLTVQMAVVVDAFLTVATGVLFIVWFWRLIKNAQLIERVSRNITGGLWKPAAPNVGWAIGSWVIPLANAVLPAYFLIRVDRISAPDGRSTRALIVGWAVAFGLTNGVARVVFRDEPTTLAAIESADRRGLWLALATVVAAVLAILVVRSVTHRQLRGLDAVRA